MNQVIYERNILSLGQTDPELAARLEHAEAAAEARFVLSRTRKTVMTYDTGTGRRALHSLFDPEKEAGRLLESFPPDGFFLFLGFGCAYQILACLEKPGVSQILIVDKDVGILKAVMGEVELGALLGDSRVRFLIDPSPRELADFLLSQYLPALAGDFHTVSLRPRVEQEEEFFRNAARLIRECIEELSADFSVQSRFGKKWFLNTLENLEAAQADAAVLPLREKAIVTGAGPSLEDGIPAIKAARRGSLLIAADTSLPVLLRHDLCPDLVVTIDCQHISYNHFMAGYPAEVPLVLDLASPAIMTRFAPKTFFFTSGHPFSRYINARWRRFPRVDTSGGNVTHAAVSLAGLLNAREIFLYGADFSYPEGKPYAREAYIYPYFRCRETRLAGLESLLARFLFRSPDTKAVWRDGKVRYTSALMLRYKEKLESSAAGIPARIVPAPGAGEVIAPHASARGNAETKIPAVFAGETSRGNWKDFLAAYRDSLAALRAPRGPVISRLRELPHNEKELWTTLLPVSAACLRTNRAEKTPASALLEHARAWTLEAVERALKKNLSPLV